MKGTSSVRRLRLRSFRTRLVPPMCFARMLVPVCVVLCVSWSCGCWSHWNGCVNVAWAMFWGGSRSTKPCFFPCKVAAATMKGTSSVRRLRLRSFRTRLVPSMCFATMVVPVCVVLCVSWSCGCWSHWNGCVNVAWAMFWGGSRSTKPCVFVKWLQATMKGTSSLRRLRLRSFRTRLVPSMCFATMVVPVCVVLSFPEAVVADRIVMAAWMLHGLCFGEEAGARNLVFFRVKWLQATMKGTSSVRRLRLRSFRTRLVPSMWFATMVVPVCVVLCVSWSCGCWSHWNGCVNVAWAMFWGGSRSTKPCFFPCKVAAGDDERYLVCAAVAAAVVPDAIGSFYVFCNNGCSCVRSSMRFLKLWLQVAL